MASAYTYLKESDKKIDKDIPMKLLHYDFHTHHAMMEGNVVTGFIDFEWSHFGDPLWDFQKLPINLSIDDKFYQDEFLKGYGLRKFTDRELLRFKMYCILQGIWQIDHTAYGDAGYPKELLTLGYTLLKNTLANY